MDELMLLGINKFIISSTILPSEQENNDVKEKEDEDEDENNNNDTNNIFHQINDMIDQQGKRIVK